MLAKIVEFPTKNKMTGGEASVSSVLRFLNKVSAIADQTVDFKQATKEIFQLVCEYTNWPIAHIYVKEGETYISKDIWFYETGIDANAIADFRRISEETVFEPGKGIIGQIAEQKEARALEDVTVLKQFLRADSAKRSGVRGFFGFPVIVTGECVGVAEFYGREIAKLDPTSLELMQYVSAQLARIYERDSHARQQRNLLEQFENSVQSSVEGLVQSAQDLSKAGQGVQEQVTTNSSVCSQVVSGRNSILENMATLNQAMGRLVDVESHTLEASDTVGQTVRSLSKDIGSARQELETLSTMTAQIEGIARNVSEIAGQVKMLGLNASIEAARAGEAGKGFAIVAAEIKSLAQQSELASQDIAEQLGGIQEIAISSAKLMMNVNGSMDSLEETTMQMNDVVKDQHDATETIRFGLDDTQSTFSGIDQDIERLNGASGDLVDLSHNVNTLVENLQQISQEISQSSTSFIRAMKVT